MTLDLPSSNEPESKLNADYSWSKVFNTADTKKTAYKEIVDDRPLGERVQEQQRKRKNGEDSGGSELDISGNGWEGFASSEESDSLGMKKKMKKNARLGNQERLKMKRLEKERKRAEKKMEKRMEKKKQRRMVKQEEEEEEEVKREKEKEKEEQADGKREKRGWNREKDGEEEAVAAVKIEKRDWKDYAQRNNKREKRKRDDDEEEGEQDHRTTKNIKREPEDIEEMEEEMEGDGWKPKQEEPEEEEEGDDEEEDDYQEYKRETQSSLPPSKKHSAETKTKSSNGQQYEVINVYDEKRKMKMEAEKKFANKEFEQKVKKQLNLDNSDQSEEDSIAFGTFDFSSGRPLPLYLAKRNRQMIPLTQKIKLAKKREKALAEEGKQGENLREFHQWKRIMDKENGLKLKESSTTLTKTLNTKQKRKKKSKEEWTKREQDQKERQEERQKRREKNIKRKKEMNLERRINRRWGIKTKSKQRRPGFEGRKKHFINK